MPYGHSNPHGYCFQEDSGALGLTADHHSWMAGALKEDMVCSITVLQLDAQA